MLKFISLASGSSGNCYYLLADGYGLLIDLGIGLRTFKNRLANYGLAMAQIQAILVTHDHTDHAKSVGALSQEFRLPVYTSQKVHDSINRNHYISKKIPAAQQHVIAYGKPCQIGPYEITSFHVPHDSAENNGYQIRVEGKNFVVLTDVGHFTDEMPAIVAEATHLVIESNYDAAMLEAGKYPQRLKKRISGPYGHISNGETAAFLANHLNKQLIRRVWLCHLSAENNLPRLAYDASAKALGEAGFELNDNANFKLEVLARQTPSLLTEL